LKKDLPLSLVELLQLCNISWAYKIKKMKDRFQRECERLDHEVDLGAKLKHISPISISSITLPLAKKIMHHSICMDKITPHKFILMNSMHFTRMVK
jgi:hypothetical protein